MSAHLHETIAELEAELESHYQASSDIERTLRYLRARAGGAAPEAAAAVTTRKGSRASSKRTDGRTDGANSAPAARAEPP